MSYNLSESELSELIAKIMTPHLETEGWNRLRHRIRQMGKNQKDELMQFRVLQQVCRTYPEIGASFGVHGLEAVNQKIFQLTPEVGAMTQAFNRYIESNWHLFD